VRFSLEKLWTVVLTKPRIIALATGLILATSAAGADPSTPAEFNISGNVLRPRDKVPPLGIDNFGATGAIEWGRNNFVNGSGNEPIYWRNLHRVMTCGPNWFEIDGGGVSWYDLWGSGFLSGADLRIYRIVDKAGNVLPPKDGTLAMDQADHVELVGKTKIIPEGSPNFPDGGWVVTKYCPVQPNQKIGGGNLSVADNSAVQNGVTYWYTVVALDAKGGTSELAPEVSATPNVGAGGGLHLLVSSQGDVLPPGKAGQAFYFEPKICGGKSPYSWTVVDSGGKVTNLPAGLKMDPATGALSGTPTQDAPPDTLLRLQVTDAAGMSDARNWVMNPGPGPDAGTKPPDPPQELQATAGDGCVTVSWKPSASPNVAAYGLMRSTAPLAKQENRVYVVDGGPEIKPYDYVVVERKFDPFDMKYVSPRVRGIGNPMDAPNWYWNVQPNTIRFSLVPHPKPIPDDMVEPGETCLLAEATATGEVKMQQTTFIGTEHGKESIWYGQLEPQKNYRLEVWLRQEGLGNKGAVSFSYGTFGGTAYPGIKQTFPVTDKWQKFTYDFTGPERPAQDWHFGHMFTFTGPGKLWMDNCRIFRADKPEDLAKPYVPNPTVFNEEMTAEPSDGPKGTQRLVIVSRNETMKSLLSWNANSIVRPDWQTGIDSIQMTVPPALTWCALTGDKPANRVVPWITIQHILHSEEDWQGFVEYLAAPYDPKTDTPQTKPWAYARYQQRGVGTPWTDEFRQIIIEMGNETWHNGVFDDWLGFANRGQVWQGGKAYGMFCRYLIEGIQTSRYWKSQNLDQRIRFALNDGYIRLDVGGKQLTYGEEAMLACPEADILSHANYFGPKWETGDKSSSVFDDEGVQETLLAYQTGNDGDFQKSQAMHDEIAQNGHPYDIAAYESGPSGYALPGQGSPEQVEVNERYGKSLAMGVAALDGWLGAYAHGWTYQGYFDFGQGGFWNSHTGFYDGFRPCTGWEAMTMRNRFVSGDMMSVEAAKVPTVNRLGKDFPLVGCYAFQDGNKWSVFVLSRKLGGKYRDQDLGDGFSEVTLHLPFKHADKVTLHKLTGDPRDNNIKELKIVPQTADIPAASIDSEGSFSVNPASGGGQGGLPPGSIFLYVFEGAQ
jgi:Putative Ig domain